MLPRSASAPTGARPTAPVGARAEALLSTVGVVAAEHIILIVVGCAFVFVGGPVVQGYGNGGPRRR